MHNQPKWESPELRAGIMWTNGLAHPESGLPVSRERGSRPASAAIPTLRCAWLGDSGRTQRLQTFIGQSGRTELGNKPLWGLREGRGLGRRAGSCSGRVMVGTRLVAWATHGSVAHQE